jgi:hypothetical protein
MSDFEETPFTCTPFYSGSGYGTLADMHTHTSTHSHTPSHRSAPLTNKYQLTCGTTMRAWVRGFVGVWSHLGGIDLSGDQALSGAHLGGGGEAGIRPHTGGDLRDERWARGGASSATGVALMNFTSVTECTAEHRVHVRTARRLGSMRVSRELLTNSLDRTASRLKAKRSRVTEGYIVMFPLLFGSMFPMTEQRESNPLSTRRSAGARAIALALGTGFSTWYWHGSRTERREQRALTTRSEECPNPLQCDVKGCTGCTCAVQ